jgi:WD40 repeat protein
MATPSDGSGGGDEYANVICSASWNRQVCLWDIRASSQKPIATLELPGKAFSMDVDAPHHRLVVATSGRRNVVIDLKSLNKQPEIVLDRESSLKFQTRTVRFFPDGRGVALGSVEGRVGVEFLEELSGLPTHSMKRFAFKCHRVNDTVYPVNCIAFHPRFTNTFATGGCDGSVVLWDGGNKKKVSWICVSLRVVTNES